MTTRKAMRPALSLATAAFLWATAAKVAWAQVAEFDEANVFAELNDTDGDLGLHALVDGEAWALLEIEDPDGRRILRIRPRQSLADQGLTEVAFESAEPAFDELSPEEFFERFPQGDYRISGLTIEGDELESSEQFRHVLPAPVDEINVADTAFDLDAIDCDVAAPAVTVGDDPVIISWDPVTQSHPEIGRAGGVNIDKYQVVVEREEPTLLIYSVDLPPDVTEAEVPSGFLALGDEFKLEILVRERSGNQTAVETCFAIGGLTRQRARAIAGVRGAAVLAGAPPRAPLLQRVTHRSDRGAQVAAVRRCASGARQAA